MADTQRTRAAILELMSDNVTGNISAQDLRDAIVSIMEPEFANVGDFWNQPTSDNLTTDQTTRGWHLYSQIAHSNYSMSFGKVYCLNASNVWSTANVSLSTCNLLLGIAADSYASGAADVKMLMKGIIFNSAMSTRTASAIGLRMYLQSELDGSVSITTTTNSTRVIGIVLPSGTAQSTAGGSSKWFFDPTWSVCGVG